MIHEVRRGERDPTSFIFKCASFSHPLILERSVRKQPQQWGVMGNNRNPNGSISLTVYVFNTDTFFIMCIDYLLKRRNVEESGSIPQAVDTQGSRVHRGWLNTLLLLQFHRQKNLHFVCSRLVIQLEKNSNQLWMCLHCCLKSTSSSTGLGGTKDLTPITQKPLPLWVHLSCLQRWFLSVWEVFVCPRVHFCHKKGAETWWLTAELYSWLARTGVWAGARPRFCLFLKTIQESWRLIYLMVLSSGLGFLVWRHQDESQLWNQYEKYSGSSFS